MRMDIVEESIVHLRVAQVSDEAIKEYLSRLKQVGHADDEWS